MAFTDFIPTTDGVSIFSTMYIAKIGVFANGNHHARKYANF